MPLVNRIDRRHERVKRADVIAWDILDVRSAARSVEDAGRPGRRTRRMARRTYLQYVFNLSSEEVVTRWVEHAVLPVFLRRAGLPASAADRPVDPVAVAQAAGTAKLRGAVECDRRPRGEDQNGLASELPRRGGGHRAGAVTDKAIAHPTGRRPDSAGGFSGSPRDRRSTPIAWPDWMCQSQWIRAAACHWHPDVPFV